MKYSVYNKNFVVMEKIVNVMFILFSEVWDKFYNLFENFVVFLNVFVGFGYFRCICMVYIWVNGICWVVSIDFVILIDGIVVFIISCICWSVFGSVVYFLLFFMFDFI